MSHISPVSNNLLPQNNANSNRNSTSSNIVTQSKEVQSNLPVDNLNNDNPELVSASDKDKNASQSLNNRTGSTDQVNENNDRNQENNKDGKIELVILEDSDHLKTPQNSNDNSKKSLQNVI